MQDNFSQRAARGQAYNLAIQEAIAEGKQNDVEAILGLYYKHLQFAALLQSDKSDALSEAVRTPQVLNLIRQLTEELNK